MIAAKTISPTFVWRLAVLFGIVALFLWSGMAETSSAKEKPRRVEPAVKRFFTQRGKARTTASYGYLKKDKGDKGKHGDSDDGGSPPHPPPLPASPATASTTAPASRTTGANATSPCPTFGAFASASS